MAQALLFLQKVLSNCERGGIDRARWRYDWSNVHGNKRKGWWAEASSGLVPYLARDIDPQDRIAAGFECCYCVNDNVLAYQLRDNFLSDLNSSNGSGNPRRIEANIRAGLEEWWGLQVVRARDCADMLRWMVRDPQGPFLKRGFLLWPETVLHALDHLETEGRVGLSSYFHEATKDLCLRKTLGFDADPHTMRAWINERESRRNGGLFLDAFLGCLWADFGVPGVGNEDLDRGVEAFLRSLWKMLVVLLRLRAVRGGATTDIRVPARPPSHFETPEDWPTSFEESREVVNAPDERYAALDIVATLFYVSIFGPQDVTHLFCHRDVEITKDALELGARERAVSTPCRERGRSELVLGEPGVATASGTDGEVSGRGDVVGAREETWAGGQLAYDDDEVGLACRAAFPHRIRVEFDTLAGRIRTDAHFDDSLVLGRGREGLMSHQRLVEASDVLVSRRQCEICFVEGAWRLFDHGMEGKGSTNATLLCRGVHALVLRGGDWVASVGSDFELKYYEGLASPDGIPLVLGVALEDGDILSVSPEGPGEVRPFTDDFDIERVHPRGSERFVVRVVEAQEDGS